MTKFEAESPEKDAKFWKEIAELKVPLGEIFDESKFKKIKCLKFIKNYNFSGKIQRNNQN